MTKDETIDMLYERIGKIRDALGEANTLLDTIYLNARMIPDPAMEGKTDCYALPIGDILAIPGVQQKIAAVAAKTPSPKRITKGMLVK